MTRCPTFSRNWKNAKLGDLGQCSGGSTPSTKVAEYWGGGVPWLVPSEVSRNVGLHISRTERTITESVRDSSGTRLMPAGTVMMTSRATIGEVVINTVPMATNQGFINIVCNENVVFNEFLAFWIQNNRDTLIARSHGVTFREITKPTFRLVPILLPPLPEQRAIARVLRAVQAARETRQREVALERERKAALMAHLFTYGTCGEPTKLTPIGELPESWEVVSLQDLLLGQPQNGVFIKSPVRGTGTRYINVFDTYQGAVVNLDMVERFEVEPKDVDTYAVKSNDLLFVRSSLKREGVGQCCLVAELPEPAVFDCHLIRVSPANELVDPFYLTYYWLSETGRANLIARSKTTTMTTINQRGLSEALLPRPTLDEQRAISSALRACDAKTAALERESALLDELFRALLEELMTGRLRVSEDTLLGG